MATKTREAPQSTAVEGRVAQILNERELAINVGSRAGVREGMKFRILAAEPLEIRDPLTDEVLGYEDREKIRVQAIRVHERYSVCSTYRVRHVPAGSALAEAMSQLSDFSVRTFQPPTEVPETLRRPHDEPLPPLPVAESYIRAGDRAIEISELPYESLPENGSSSSK